MAEAPKDLNQPDIMLERLLLKTAKDRAASLRYNTRALALSYGTLAIVVIMGLLGVNVYIVAATAVAGLGIFLVFTSRQGKKLEKQIYEEEVAYYKSLIASTPPAPAAIPVDTPDAAKTVYAGQMPLSQRELEILRLIAKGNMNKEIAQTLGLSTHTVRNYTVQIMKKMECDDRTSAAVIAISRGWIKS
jgi:DNA-binding NarL/FixJ family response regulator